MEVQKKDTRNLPRRSRFYQSLMDGRLLKPGESDFNQLKDICLIIIAPFDIFGYEKYQYTFEMRCQEIPELAMEDVSPELVELLYYMEHSNLPSSISYQSSRVRELRKNVNTIVENEEMGVRFMQAWEELLLERQEGREEGLQLQLQNQIKKKLLKGQSVEQIAEALEETPERIQQLIDKMS